MITVLSLISVMAFPIVTSADTAGTTISGTITSTATLTKPSDVNLGTLHVGVNSGSSTAGSVVANGTGWTLTVSDTKTATKGYMTVGGTDVGAELANPLTVCKTVNGSYSTIADYQSDLQGSSGYGQATTFNIPLFVKQTVLASDGAGTYQITLTFIVTPGT